MFHGFFCFFKAEKVTLKMKKINFQNEKVAVLLKKVVFCENCEKSSRKYFQNYAVTMKSSRKGKRRKEKKW